MTYTPLDIENDVPIKGLVFGYCPDRETRITRLLNTAKGLLATLVRERTHSARLFGELNGKIFEVRDLERQISTLKETIVRLESTPIVEPAIAAEAQCCAGCDGLCEKFRKPTPVVEPAIVAAGGWCAPTEQFFEIMKPWTSEDWGKAWEEERALKKKWKKRAKIAEAKLLLGKGDR